MINRIDDVESSTLEANNKTLKSSILDVSTCFSVHQTNVSLFIFFFFFFFFFFGVCIFVLSVIAIGRDIFFKCFNLLFLRRGRFHKINK